MRSERPSSGDRPGSGHSVRVPDSARERERRAHSGNLYQGTDLSWLGNLGSLLEKVTAWDEDTQALLCAVAIEVTLTCAYAGVPVGEVLAPLGATNGRGVKGR